MLRSDVSSERAKIMKMEEGGRGAKGSLGRLRRGGRKGSRRDTAKEDKVTITASSATVIDYSSQARWPREKFMIGPKYSVQVADVSFKGSTGYLGLILCREGSVNEATGKETKPFMFSQPISNIFTLNKVLSMLIDKAKEEKQE